MVQIDRMDDMADDEKPFDPASLGDPLATRTEWTSIGKGIATNFPFVRTVVEVNGERLELRGALDKKFVFALVVSMVAFLLLVLFEKSLIRSFGLYLGVFLTLYWIAGAGILGVMLYRGTIPIIFDKHQGLFWKNRKSPGELAGKLALQCYAELKRVHAFQLIEVMDNDRFFGFEMNLVLENGERVHVEMGRNYKQLREHADRAAAFLGKPVWNGIHWEE